MPDMFQAWILFCLQHTRHFIGAIMQQSTENTLTDAEMAAYDAPFPSFIYMAGPRTLPSMNAGIVGQQLGAWENLKKFEKPFISFIGLKEKLLAAHRAGIKEVIIPKENEKDLVDMPKKIIDDIKITPVDHADQVLKVALTKELKRTEWVEVDIYKKDDKTQASIQ